jgi:hypothetical protein
MIDTEKLRIRRSMRCKSLAYFAVSYAIAVAVVSLIFGPPTVGGIISGIIVIGLFDYFRYRRRLRKGLLSAAQGE